MTIDQLKVMFDEYFYIFPWGVLPKEAVGFDLGCGSGRWDSFVAQRVGKLYCIDPSSAAPKVAKENVKGDNVEFFCASVDSIPLDDNSMDFGFSLGVLHHIPDTQQGIISCVKKLKTGAPFLLYLYYSLDNKPKWFRFIWRCSDILRRIISRMPYVIKKIISQIIAFIIYFPFARFAQLMEKCGKDVSNYPLSAYRNKKFYSMRTDSYDRFCTRLERRFSKIEIETMMVKAGLSDISFNDKPPFWCAVGYKK